MTSSLAAPPVYDCPERQVARSRLLSCRVRGWFYGFLVEEIYTREKEIDVEIEMFAECTPGDHIFHGTWRQSDVEWIFIVNLLEQGIQSEERYLNYVVAHTKGSWPFRKQLLMRPCDRESLGNLRERVLSEEQEQRISRLEEKIVVLDRHDIVRLADRVARLESRLDLEAKSLQHKTTPPSTNWMSDYP